MTVLYRGFVQIKNKRSVQPFKDLPGSALLTEEQANTFPEYAGVLADDYMVIDIDDKEQANIVYKIIKEKGINTKVVNTDRGKHFYFKNPGLDKNGTHKPLACGVIGDIKVGCKNSYAVIKKEGKKRKVIRKCDECDMLPGWLFPVKTVTDFFKLGDGDGRNQALFNYILALQRANLSPDECRECIRLINKYILKEPLDNQELDIILRDEAFERPNFKLGNTFLHEDMARYLIKQRHVCYINGELHIYKDGCYVRDDKAIEKAMCELMPNIIRSKRAEVMSSIQMYAPTKEMSDAKYILFRNGVLDIESDEFFQHDPNYVITNMIHGEYIPDIDTSFVEEKISAMACGDKDIKRLLEEVAGYTLYRRNELRKAIIFIGDKHNGKSTYLSLIGAMLGEENTTSLDIKDIGDKFRAAELSGVLACIGDDISDEFIPDPSKFKKVVSGDRMTVERKGKDPFDFNPYAKLLFSANSIPRMRDKSGAVIDRLVIVPFKAEFTKDKPGYDAFLKYKLKTQDNINALIKLAVSGLKRVLENQEFSITDEVIEQLKEYEKTNDPVLEFIQDITEDDVVNKTAKHVYAKYKEWCISYGYTPGSAKGLSSKVNKMFGTKTVNRRIENKQHRVFVRR